MQRFDEVIEYLRNFSVYGTIMDLGDVLEILIIALLVYYVLVWMKATRAWTLLKGLIVIGGFLFIASIFKMNTILWMAQNVLGIAVTALVVILQPELRKALEELGRKNILTSIIPSTVRMDGSFSEDTVREIVKACMEMGKVRTGALIVIEKNVSLQEFVRTGIDVDGLVTNQLLINIFEKNTPLHDGAVIVRGNRILAATCYLPLSDNLALSKELGTRHRAGVGISEVSDSITVIVSEETGRVSVAYEGELNRNLDAENLRTFLMQNMRGGNEENKSKRKGRNKGKDADSEEITE
ncbi:MAG: diadenylate cyclase CdaA [Lachnospiraceae bacterium]|nr:diadenylate cyclase CdaA [Lachnospiraceae bacterium]